MKGKIRLADLEVLNDLYNLFMAQDKFGKYFRHEIRAYNIEYSFASMGVKVDETMNNMRGGAYTFRVHGGVYHKIDQLVPRDGTPRHLQLYFYYAQAELASRLNNKSNLDRNTTQIIRRVLTNNPYVYTFRKLGELGPLDKIPW
jgi:hypothetical protein